MSHMRRIMLCALAMTIAGCDTVAEISFDNEQVMALLPLGFVSPVCDDFGDADAVFRFNAKTSLDHRVVPGKRLVGMESEIMPGSTFGAENVLFSDAWAFEVGADGEDVTCAADAECGQGKCLSVEQMGLTSYYYAPKRYCVVPLAPGVTAAPRFSHYRDVLAEGEGVVSQNMNGRSIAFVMDNSATLDGSDRDGTAQDAYATDPYQYRRVGLNAFMEALSEGEQGPYEFSTHFANGVGNDGVYDVASSWFRTIAQWKAGVLNKYPTPSGASPIWEAADAALTRLIDQANTAYSRTMVVFTDGAPNDSVGDAYASFDQKLSTPAAIALSWIDYTVEGVSPTRQYAESVAKQCGTYFHFNAADQIPRVMSRIAYATEAWWDVGISLGARLETGKLYRVAANVVLSLGNGAARFEAQRKLENAVVIDDRLFIVK